MRIPYGFDRNTFATYKVPPIFLHTQQIKSHDYTWDSHFVKTLREMCLIIIAENWKNNPLYDAVEIRADKLQLLELIPTDLPMELTVPIIHEDFYWERSYKARWPNAPEPNRRYKYDNPVNEEIILNVINEPCPEKTPINPENKSVNCSEEMNVYSFSNFTEVSGLLSETSGTTVDSGTSSYEFNKKSESHVVVDKSWKQCVLEKFVEGEIERMKPDVFNPEYIKELTDLFGDYILSLNIKQLQACKNEISNDHVYLHSLLARLPNLIEFSVCFSQAKLKDEFRWQFLKVSETDCDLLGKGVEKSLLKILRVKRSAIDCEKIKLILRPLCNHNTLLTLDLSHCKIADEGAKAIAGFLQQNKILEKLILINNKIGPEGAKGLAFYLSQPDCRLIELNLKLNPLRPAGGKFVATALARKAKSLQILNLSCCGLTSENLHIGLALALNNTLKKLDLSNNRLGEEAGLILLHSVEKNRTIIQLNIRMCSMFPETVQDIQSCIRLNLERYRSKLISPPLAEDIL